MSSLTIHHALVLTKQLFDAEGVMFYWINEYNQSAYITDCINVSHDFIDSYHRELQDLDPLNVKNFLKSKEAFSSLTECRRHHPCTELSVYDNYIKTYGIEETFDLLFWKNNHAYAGIGVTNPNLKQLDQSQIKSLHYILEQNLLQLKPIQKNIIFHYLENYSLTNREKEVCLYLLDGLSNSEIAEYMGIKVGTVKINLNRILDKLNLTCRLQIAKQLNALFQLPDHAVMQA
ncbi:hypothetical protein BS636_01595 [Acinetobacter sp. LoGeW2-3]|uniref:helix-turn-helix domain-containing protein n=1 Tax=Acinetobacter sp. LoGeW2-3 TaxID=1808001 RepID=UPI000C05C910|nr:helix-turn-helix transcriptional regulator [Acinetobacter sp. LoGeW2-3]ATO18455.1 hypothetical protein BS636_01595 [Acinetobacter sp. LoGeW2-3]